MKKFMIAVAALVLTASVASATNPVSCEKSQQQNTYKCNDGNGGTFNVSNVNSAQAAANAVAAAIAEQNQEQNQGQAQGQGQSQTSENSNSNSNSNVNGGNSVNFEGDPAHTTSLNANIGVNLSLPLASGVQMKNAIDAANWFYERGDTCTAFHIMSKAPRVRNLNINFTCGDKG